VASTKSLKKNFQTESKQTSLIKKGSMNFIKKLPHLHNQL